MISLMIKNPDLPTGYVIENTSWYLARDKDFTDIVAQSIEDTVNKLNIQFNNELEFGIKYYAKSRVVYNKGFSNYSNINVFVARDLNEIELDLYVPTKISRPFITILPDQEEKPTGLLSFSGGAFVSKYNIAHKTSTYILEDITGKVVWSKISDSVNLENIVLPIALEENSAYRLIVAYEGRNNNTSQFAVETFITGKNEISLNGDLGSVPAGLDLTINVNLVELGMQRVEYALYAEGGYLATSSIILDVTNTDMKTWKIPGEYIKKDINYIIVVKAYDYSGNTTAGYFYFRPYFDLSKTPNTSFQYENVIDYFVPNYTVDMFGTSSGYRPSLPNGEIIQSVGLNGNVILNFFYFDTTTNRFAFSGRTFNLGDLFGVASGIKMDDFSYMLLDNSLLVMKCAENDLLISVPYSVVSGDIDLNLLRVRKLDTTADSKGKALTQHGIVPISSSYFITYSRTDRRLLKVNSMDLSYSNLNSKVYDTAPNYLAIYKISQSLMLVVETAADGLTAKYDIYNFKTNNYLIVDRELDVTGISLLDSDATTMKVVPLFNGTVLCIFKSSAASEAIYKLLNITNVVSTIGGSNTESSSAANWVSLEVDSDITLGIKMLIEEGQLLPDPDYDPDVIELISSSNLIVEATTESGGIYTLTKLMEDSRYIKAGVYSLLNNGTVLQISSTAGLIFR